MRMGSFIKTGSLSRLFVMGLIGCGPALAQPPPAPVPPEITPGQVGDTLRPTPELQRPATISPLERSRETRTPATDQGRNFTVQRFEFSGNTLYGTAELQALLQKYLNRPLSLLDLYAAADRITDHYVEHGYTLASVTVPPQRIDGGTVQLSVSEGRLSNVTAENNRLYTTAQLVDYLDQLRPGAIYRSTDLDHSLRIINELPGLRSRAVVRPGQEYGTTELVLRAEEQAVEGSLTVDNYGRESIGEFRLTGLVQFNNPLKIEDQLQLMALGSEDGLLGYGYAAYSLPVNNLGTRATLSYGYASFEVVDATVDGQNRSGRLRLDHPLVRTARDQFSVSFGISHTRANADLLGTTFNETEVALFEVGGLYSHAHADAAVSQVSLDLATNFARLTRDEILNAGAGQRLRGDQQLRVELDLQHVRPLFRSLQLVMRANGVYSPDPLVDTQQYSIGGPSSIRGFPASEVRGDRGYFGQITLRQPFQLGPARFYARVFADSGVVMVVDPAIIPPATTAASERETLTSTGVGLDAQWAHLAFKLDWSFPRGTHTASDGDDDQRLFGSVSLRF